MSRWGNYLTAAPPRGRLGRVALAGIADGLALVPFILRSPATRSGSDQPAPSCHHQCDRKRGRFLRD